MSDETKRTLVMAGIAFVCLALLLVMEDYARKQKFWKELNVWRISQDRFAEFLDDWERRRGELGGELGSPE